LTAAKDYIVDKATAAKDYIKDTFSGKEKTSCQSCESGTICDTHKTSCGSCKTDKLCDTHKTSCGTCNTGKTCDTHKLGGQHIGYDKSHKIGEVVVEEKDKMPHQKFEQVKQKLEPHIVEKEKKHEQQLH